MAADQAAESLVDDDPQLAARRSGSRHLDAVLGSDVPPHPGRIRGGRDAPPQVRRQLLLGLQRSAGNGVVARSVSSRPVAARQEPIVLQRACDCGGSCPTCAGKTPVEIPDEASLPGAHLQRTPAVIQREADPADLTGTNFASLDSQLVAKLKDKAVFNWGGFPTLATSLNDLPNTSIATMARIGAMISATAPFLWQHVAGIGRGGWITDNFGMGFTWKSGEALGTELAGRGDFCRDNPITAKYYHGTTSAYRQIGAKSGGPTMHIITGGRTEVHIDAHQPVEGKETSWPWAGQCNYDMGAWSDHAGDVAGGGSGGARGTAVARYGVARDNINQRKQDDYYRADPDDTSLTKATAALDAIVNAVQRYAAMGKIVGDEFEGDRAMLNDAETMAKLTEAESTLSELHSTQNGRHPDPIMDPMD